MKRFGDWEVRVSEPHPRQLTIAKAGSYDPNAFRVPFEEARDLHYVIGRHDQAGRSRR